MALSRLKQSSLRYSKGLLGMTLRYPYEVREENAYFDEIPIGRFLAASSCNFKV